MAKVEVKRINVINGTSNLKAYCDVLFGNFILICGCKVVEGPNGLFAALPTTKGKEDKWYPVVRLESDEYYQEFQKVVIAKYNNNGQPEPEEPVGEPIDDGLGGDEE